METLKNGAPSRGDRKRAVSIRMSSSDIRKIKRLAERLGVRDSDVIRFAVKSVLAKLSPLDDPAVRGRNLVPVFVESGSELLRFFDLDAMRLDNIINDEAENERRVDHEDIQLIAMNGVRPPYVRWQLPRSSTPDAAHYGVDRFGDEPQGAAIDRRIERDEAGSSLREYLYQKYVQRPLGGT
jgi:hypothetical protein